MRPEFPIECRCSHRQVRFQLGFARRALELLPRTEDTIYEPESRGLVVLAQSETALERPVEILRDAYGDDVRIGPPSVRYRQKGDTLEEPHMGVRVLCAPEHLPAVRRELEARGATVAEAEVTALFGIVRATGALAALLGFPRRLSELTGGRARHTMWLSHYAPVEDEPPGGSAA